MNAYIERIIGSVRRKALGHFMLISEKQVRKTIREYIEYYNNYRTIITTQVRDSS